MEEDLTEERSRYQGLLSEHRHLEERHRDLKEKMELSIVRNQHTHSVKIFWIVAD